MTMLPKTNAVFSVQKDRRKRSSFQETFTRTIYFKMTELPVQMK